MLFLVAVSALTSAQLDKPTSVFSPNDYPAYLENSGKSAVLLTRTTLDFAGNIQSCTIEIPSVDPRVDALTCALIREKGKFTPARWSDGTAAIGVFRLPVVWTTRPGATLGADIELFVSALPKRKSFLVTQLTVAVSPDGTITDCNGKHIFSAADEPSTPPELVALACTEATNGWIPIVARDSAGRPQRSVQNLAVKFVKSTSR